MPDSGSRPAVASGGGTSSGARTAMSAARTGSRPRPRSRGATRLARALLRVPRMRRLAWMMMGAVVGGCAVEPAARPPRAACGEMVELWCARAFECTSAADRRARNAPLTVEACVAQWREIAGCDERPLAARCGAPTTSDAPLEACTRELAEATCAAIDASEGLCPTLCPPPPTDGPVRVSWTIRDPAGHARTCAEVGAATTTVVVTGGEASLVARVPCSAYAAETGALPPGRYEATVYLIDPYERPLRSATVTALVAPPITSVGPIDVRW